MRSTDTSVHAISSNPLRLYQGPIRRKTVKKILGVYSAPGPHWVGDGFPVRSLFSYNSHGRHLSPFLLLDYAGPASFTPTLDQRGVGEHPHRGFETVTIVYQGEVQHRDSTGAGGTIGPGDVQWMTAGAGILHEEFHSQAFAKSGGTLDMVQLWVNLPAKDKMTIPSYQTLLSKDIPVIELPEDSGSLRVIAGEYGGQPGPARTFSAMDVWDLRLLRGRSVSLPFKAGRTAALVVLRGAVQINDSEITREAQLVLLDREAGEVLLEANSDAAVLVLSGEPLNDPVVGYGPFVMNSEAQIAEAIEDFNAGRFGRIAQTAGNWASTLRPSGS
jgi:quercetin 2,3-dioxygenase